MASDIDRPGIGDDDSRDPEGRETSILDLLAWVWRQRVYLVGGIVVGLLLAGVYLALDKVRSYEVYSEYIIQFRFEGRGENRYPNGTPFSLGDIVAPAVLSEVYREEELANYGLSFPDFQSAVSVSPYTPERRFIIDRYSQIDTRRASVAEINEAQAALERELSNASSRYAALRFSDPSGVIPPARAGAVLIRIAREWERVTVATRGVLELDIATVPAAVFAEESVTGLERLNALRVIRENIDRLRTFVDSLAEQPGGMLIRDPDTGGNVATLRANVTSAALQLAEVPANWPSSLETTRNDILGMPIDLYSEQLFTASELSDLDYLIALDLLQQRSRLIRDNVTRILDRPYGPVTEDPKTGLTARDVGRLLSDVEEFSLKQLTAPVLSLGIAKNPQAVRLYYQSRLDELKREKQTLGNKARVLEEASRNYQGLSASVGTTPGVVGTGTAPSGTFPPNTATVIPQFGDAFLDRIISLSQQGNDSQFRQKLLEDTVTLQQQATEIDSEIARISEYLNRFDTASENSTPEAIEQRSFFVKNLDARLPEALAKLRGFSEITTRIAYRLRFAEDIQSVTSGEGQGTGLQVDYYLRQATDANVTLPDVLGQLRAITESANRIYSQISSEALGSYQRLFAASSNPQLQRPSLVNRFDILVLAMAAGIGFLLALAYVVLRQALRLSARRSYR